MIRRDKGKIILTCDGCGQYERDSKWVPYKARWQEAQAAGWTAQADGKNWKHRCPKCNGASARVIARNAPHDTPVA